MIDWTKVAVGIFVILFCAAVVAIWNLIRGKADKKELEKVHKDVDIKADKKDLEKIVTDFDSDIKAMTVRMDQFVVTIAQSVTKTDLMKDLGTAATRSDDKELRVNRDVTELKTDLKALTEKVAAVDKKLDEIPARVASLELSRNKNKE